MSEPPRAIEARGYVIRIVEGRWWSTAYVRTRDGGELSSWVARRGLCPEQALVRAEAWCRRDRLRRPPGFGGLRSSEAEYLYDPQADAPTYSRCPTDDEPVERPPAPLHGLRTRRDFPGASASDRRSRRRDTPAERSSI